MMTTITTARFRLQGNTAQRLSQFLQAHPALTAPVRTTFCWHEGLYPPPRDSFGLCGSFTGVHPEDVYDLHARLNTDNAILSQMVWTRDAFDQLECIIYMMPAAMSSPAPLQLV